MEHWNTKFWFGIVIWSIIALVFFSNTKLILLGNIFGYVLIIGIAICIIAEFICHWKREKEENNKE